MRHLAGIRLHILSAILLAGFAAFVAGCGGDSGDESPSGASGTSAGLDPKSITFMAGFKPQANLPFVGVYVAQEKGFFDELNLDVDIRHAQSGEHLQLLLAGEIQVATANAAQVVQRRAEDLPIALVGQKSEQGFAVGANSGIKSVADWAGKKFGYKSSVPVEFLAIAKANGLDPDDVEQVKVSFDPRVLSEGQVDILAVFVSNEPGQLDRIGYPVTVFDPSDYDIPVLGLTYISSQDAIEKDSEVLERFLRGALKGIEYAGNNVQEAVDIVLKYAPQEVREQQEFMLTTELARAATPLTNTYGYGWQTPEQWTALIGALKEFGIVTQDVDASAVFTSQLLEAVYEDTN
jgi:ABC-type nitrate/sulfonate/bicarbonate transport system substrate-binding protein